MTWIVRLGVAVVTVGDVRDFFSVSALSVFDRDLLQRYLNDRTDVMSPLVMAAREFAKAKLAAKTQP